MLYCAVSINTVSDHCHKTTSIETFDSKIVDTKTGLILYTGHFFNEHLRSRLRNVREGICHMMTVSITTVSMTTVSMTTVSMTTVSMTTVSMTTVSMFEVYISSVYSESYSTCNSIYISVQYT